MLKIWGRANSLNVQKVLWCCEEMNLPFERIDWAGSFGGTDDPDFRAMNPNGRVPTIKDGETVVWESNTILRYLCSEHRREDLLPQSPAARSEVERWMDWQLASINPPMITLLLGYYRSPPDQRDPVALEAARKQALVQWSILNGLLATHRFLTGADFTLADIGNGILVHRWYSYPVERPDLPHLHDWYERLKQRQGFQSYVAGPVS